MKMPHIALLALDIMDTLGISYQVLGGPSHCCGVLQLRAGDVETSGRIGSNSIEKMSHSKSGQVLSWCPSCYVQFTETTLPILERQNGARPFEMTPFIRFLASKLDELKPHLHGRIEFRVALHKHPGVAGLMEAAVNILQAVPGVELIDLKQPTVGLQSVSQISKRLGPLCEARRTRGPEGSKNNRKRVSSFPLHSRASHTASRSI
jgi:heterodisulfide reductase subunit D